MTNTPRFLENSLDDNFSLPVDDNIDEVIANWHTALKEAVALKSAYHTLPSTPSEQIDGL